MADLLTQGERWLAGTFSASVSVSATYRRQGLTATVRLTLGGLQDSPLGNSPVATQARVGYLPAVDLTLGGVISAPAVGDVLTWGPAGGGNGLLALGPWGPNRSAGRRVEDGWTWQVFGQDLVALSDRKTVKAVLERPKKAGAPRNEFGEPEQSTRYESVPPPVKIELSPLAAAEEVTGDRLQELSKYLVFIDARRAVSASWRLAIKTGALAGHYLFIESVTPLVGYSTETMLVCRLAGS
jgi:hypothetical protein